MEIACKLESDKEVKEKKKRYQKDKKSIICAFCNSKITDPDQKIAVNGGHNHIFANPHGIVFEIGCFKTAPGCSAFDPPSYEFTWFSGYSWRIAVCRNCSNHLGWSFASKSNAFFGLILERLIMQ